MASKRTSKRSISKIPPKTAERIVAISLQHPKLGARRLAPLLKKKRISVSTASIQSILRRQGLQSREKRLAKIKKQARKPKSRPKKPSAKIPDKVAERIVELSLQNPDYGARRLTPLLQQEEIFVSASAAYTILKRNNIENRQKRILKLEELQALETPPAPEAEGPEPVPEQLKIELPPVVGEVPEAVFEPAVVVPMPPRDEMPVPTDMPEPVPELAVVAPAEPERPPLRKAPIKPVKKGATGFFTRFIFCCLL